MQFTPALRRALSCVLSLVSLAFAAGRADSAEGVEAGIVRFAQTADLSGSRAALAKELNAGTQAYFSLINEQGGVHGRKVLLQTDDDGYDPARTREIVSRHISDDDALAFVSTIGTANAVAVMPLIEKARIPLVAPLSGAVQLREPASRQVFHIRASYAQEVDKMIEHVKVLPAPMIHALPRLLQVLYESSAPVKPVAMPMSRLSYLTVDPPTIWMP